MSQAAATHPTPEQLAAFVRGSLNHAEDEQIEVHVASCDECTHTLSALSDDTIVGLLRQPAAPSWEQATLPPVGELTSAEEGRAPRKVVPPELVDHPRYEVL